MWSRLTEMVLTNSNTHPGRKFDYDADDMLEEIVRTCLEFQPAFTLTLHGKEFNYPDVFADEIAFVVSVRPSS